MTNIETDSQIADNIIHFTEKMVLIQKYIINKYWCKFTKKHVRN